VLGCGDGVEVDGQGQPGVIGQHSVHDPHGGPSRFNGAVLGSVDGDELGVDRAAAQLANQFCRGDVTGSELPRGGDPFGQAGVHFGPR
jgi:hypothetical protein